MQTLNFKKPEKQKRSAEETLNIFVPLAYFIGAFRLKCQLEDICLSYIEPEVYKSLEVKSHEILNDYQKSINIAESQIKDILKENHIDFISDIS